MATAFRGPPATNLSIAIFAWIDSGAGTLPVMDGLAFSSLQVAHCATPLAGLMRPWQTVGRGSWTPEDPTNDKPGTGSPFLSVINA